MYCHIAVKQKFVTFIRLGMRSPTSEAIEETGDCEHVILEGVEDTGARRRRGHTN